MGTARAVRGQGGASSAKKKNNDIKHTLLCGSQNPAFQWKILLVEENVNNMWNEKRRRTKIMSCYVKADRRL